MSTRNITLSLPTDLVRSAKILAAQQDTSVSALVADLLRQAARQHSNYDLVWSQEEQRMAEGIGLQVGAITWSRNDLHER